MFAVLLLYSKITLLTVRCTDLSAFLVLMAKCFSRDLLDFFAFGFICKTHSAKSVGFLIHSASRRCVQTFIFYCLLWVRSEQRPTGRQQRRDFNGGGGIHRKNLLTFGPIGCIEVNSRHTRVARMINFPNEAVS